MDPVHRIKVYPCRGVGGHIQCWVANYRGVELASSKHRETIFRYVDDLLRLTPEGLTAEEGILRNRRR